MILAWDIMIAEHFTNLCNMKRLWLFRFLNYILQFLIVLIDLAFITDMILYYRILDNHRDRARKKRIYWILRVIIGVMLFSSGKIGSGYLEGWTMQLMSLIFLP